MQTAQPNWLSLRGTSPTCRRPASDGGGTEPAFLPAPRAQPVPSLLNPPAPPYHIHTPLSGGLVRCPFPSGTAGRAAAAVPESRAPRESGLRASPRNPKCEAAVAGGCVFTQRQPRVTGPPLPAPGEDVAGMRSAPDRRPGLGAVPGDPGLRWRRGHLLHAGPGPRAPDARIFLLRGSSGPGGPGAGPEGAHL